MEILFAVFICAVFTLIGCSIKRMEESTLIPPEEPSELMHGKPGLYGIDDITAYESQEEISESIDSGYSGRTSSGNSHYSAGNYSPTPSSYYRDTRTDAYIQGMQERYQAKRREERRAESRARSEAYAAARREAKAKRQASGRGSRSSGYAPSSSSRSSSSRSSSTRSSTRSSSRSFGGGSSRGGGSGRKF